MRTAHENHHRNDRHSGDVQPFVALELGLQDAGHQVQIATDAQIQKTANQLGEQIRGENGVVQAVDLIDSYLQQPQQLMRFKP